jgi:putative oxidoreductase
MFSQIAALVLRLVLGAIFVVHGAMKFLQMAGMVQFFSKIGVPLPGVAVPTVALVEVIGGLALILGLGLGTRILAVLLAIDMVFAIVMVKLQAGLVGGYEYELVLLAGLVAIALNGAGQLALVREKAATASA